MFKVCRHCLSLSIFSKIIIDIGLKFSGCTNFLLGYQIIKYTLLQLKFLYSLHVRGMSTYTDFVIFLEEGNRHRVEIFRVHQFFNRLSNDISHIKLA